MMIFLMTFFQLNWAPGWQFNRIFWPPKSWPNSSPTRSRSFLGRRPSLGGPLVGLKILLNCHPVLLTFNSATTTRHQFQTMTTATAATLQGGKQGALSK